MTTMTFDKLAYIDRLKAVGFTEPQARGMADGLDQALREMATKSDIASVRQEIDLFRAEIRSELADFRSGVSAAMKINKRNFLTALVVLLAGQTAVFTALDLLGH